MIFVTIGTQEPFNRLLRAIDEIGEKFPEEEIIAQAFDLDFQPKHIKLVDLLPTKEFNKLFTGADLIVSHAGMGNIISALQFSKQMIVLPRQASLGEHRNDHQLDTARKFESLGYINVAYDVETLKKQINMYFDGSLSTNSKTLGDSASDTLISSIREFIYSQKKR